MRLRLTPKGTLWSSLAMASMSAVFLTIALAAALYAWILRAFSRTETPPLAKARWGQSMAPIY